MSICTYTPPNVSSKDAWRFQNPTITITRTPILSGWGQRIIGYHEAYTIRSFITAANADELSTRLYLAQRILLHNRGEFVWEDMEDTIVKVNPKLDMRWGPYVTGWNVEQFWGVQCARITWQMETYRYANAYQDKPGAPYDLTYTIATQIDQHFYSMRTITGVLTMRSGGLRSAEMMAKLEKPNDCADNYRALISKQICACPTLWQRISLNFALSEDGLSLAFTVVDQQRYALLPENITDGTVTLVSNANFSSPGIPQSDEKAHSLTVSGWFEGPPDHPEAPQTAIDALYNSLWESGGSAAPGRGAIYRGGKMLQIQFQRELYRNYVGFSFTWVFPTDETLKYKMVGFEDLNDDYGYIPGEMGWKDGKWGYPDAHWGYTRHNPAIQKPILVENDTTATAYYAATDLICLATLWLADFKAGVRGGASSTLGFYGTTTNMGYCGKGTLGPELRLDQNASLEPEKGLGQGKTLTKSDSNIKAPKKPAGADDIAAFYTWQQEFHYRFDYGRVILPVKKANTIEVIQQTRCPQVYLEIRGEATAQKVPAIPLPPYCDPKLPLAKRGILLHKEVTPGLPVRGAMRVAWQYLIKLPLANVNDTLRTPNKLQMPTPTWSDVPITQHTYPIPDDPE